jgi:protein phosphatase
VKRLGTGLSDVGRRRRTNQDAFIADDELGLYVVADGMGGHKGGEVASQEAVDTIHDAVVRERAALDEVEPLPSENLWDPDTTPPVMFQALRSLESAVQAAGYMVYGLAQHEPEREGMGTTISVLALRGRFALTAQVGDSRIYLAREGKALQLTQDHTLINWQLKKGLITEEQARRSKEKHIITRAVGSKEYVDVDTHFLRVQPGDSFLLCSDGLYAYVDEAQIARFLKLKPENAVRRLVSIANRRGGHDNITAVVVKLS